jgi:hypothetical protein
MSAGLLVVWEKFTKRCLRCSLLRPLELQNLEVNRLGRLKLPLVRI